MSKYWQQKIEDYDLFDGFEVTRKVKRVTKQNREAKRLPKKYLKTKLNLTNV